MRFLMLVVVAVLFVVGPLEASHRRVERTVTKARTSADTCACGCAKVGCDCGLGKPAAISVQTRFKTRR